MFIIDYRHIKFLNKLLLTIIPGIIIMPAYFYYFDGPKPTEYEASSKVVKDHEFYDTSRISRQSDEVIASKESMTDGHFEYPPAKGHSKDSVIDIKEVHASLYRAHSRLLYLIVTLEESQTFTSAGREEIIDNLREIVKVLEKSQATPIISIEKQREDIIDSLREIVRELEENKAITFNERVEIYDSLRKIDAEIEFMNYRLKIFQYLDSDEAEK